MVKYYKCKHCGQIVLMVKETNVPILCCGEEMVELTPNSTDAVGEKHVPVIERNGHSVTVKVGSVPHPMIKEHYIEWITLETNKGTQTKKLSYDQAPEATFLIAEDEIILSAYEYCNLHSLWSKNKD